MIDFNSAYSQLPPDLCAFAAYAAACAEFADGASVFEPWEVRPSRVQPDSDEPLRPNDDAEVVLADGKVYVPSATRSR